MKRILFDVLRISFPFLLTIVLWRLSWPWLNPAGVLAIIPIFYCSVIKQTPYFVPFAILFCFLIDYKFDSLMTWTIFFCLFYAIAGFQTVIDFTHTVKNGIYAFMIFVGTVILFMTMYNLNIANILSGMAMFALVSALYVPITTIIARVKND